MPRGFVPVGPGDIYAQTTILRIVADLIPHSIRSITPNRRHRRLAWRPGTTGSAMIGTRVPYSRG
jgi:hypothetical protein